MGQWGAWPSRPRPRHLRRRAGAQLAAGLQGCPGSVPDGEPSEAPARGLCAHLRVEACGLQASLSRTLSGQPGREIRAHTDPQTSDPLSLLSSLLHLLLPRLPRPPGSLCAELEGLLSAWHLPWEGPPTTPPPGAEEAPGPRGPGIISFLLGSLGGPSWWGGSHPRGAGWGGGGGGHRPPQQVRKAGAHSSEDVDGQVS